MAFGFLGFALFLLGIGGSIDAEAAGGAAVRIQVAKISPGAFVMLCAAILVGLCATTTVPLDFTLEPAEQGPQGAGNEPRETPPSQAPAEPPLNGFSPEAPMP
jgi:hypothetical protein